MVARRGIGVAPGEEVDIGAVAHLFGQALGIARAPRRVDRGVEALLRQRVVAGVDRGEPGAVPGLAHGGQVAERLVERRRFLGMAARRIVLAEISLPAGGLQQGVGPLAIGGPAGGRRGLAESRRNQAKKQDQGGQTRVQRAAAHDTAWYIRARPDLCSAGAPRRVLFSGQGPPIE